MRQVKISANRRARVTKDMGSAFMRSTQGFSRLTLGKTGSDRMQTWTMHPAHVISALLRHIMNTPQCAIALVWRSAMTLLAACVVGATREKDNTESVGCTTCNSPLFSVDFDLI